MEAINSAMAYCRAAITELENMKLAPAVGAERIAAMKAGIPKIDVYTGIHQGKTVSSHQYSFTNGLEHRAGFNEKFKELMGRPA